MRIEEEGGRKEGGEDEGWRKNEEGGRQDGGRGREEGIKEGKEDGGRVRKKGRKDRGKGME